MTKTGLDASRIAFVGKMPGPEYFALYGKIDIALDPFPCAGGTTTCDAMWMGVPVVTLAGRTAVGRSGVSLLSNVGLRQLVAESPDEYVSIAAELARDSPGVGRTAKGVAESHAAIAADRCASLCAEYRKRIPRNVAAMAREKSRSLI